MGRRGLLRQVGGRRHGAVVVGVERRCLGALLLLLEPMPETALSKCACGDG